MASVSLTQRPLGKPGRVTLTDFLLARITENEAMALSAGRNRDRALAECWAQRQVVHLHEDPGHPCGEPYPCTSLRILALPHTNHHDYNARWRPASTSVHVVSYGRHRG
jgi:hypothetical protein